ncbi:pantoate--beta-alanine ligase [Rhodoligotrophos defluvii]|uniref:pantoate--beta-alanine ligase n=1 Tax=Rhodoligotrophos defluvii TaxID=2561934 RepID=UPI0010C9B765|nr:pantoate--beta-alanine ligase [Rhodoligotrophos defluvii]
MSEIPVARTIAELRAHVRAWHQAGQTVALVPTMGALHRGHLALVEEGLRRADQVAASIFVNPKQFAPTEDFDAYPRREADDLAKLKSAGAALAFVPGGGEMYAAGFATAIAVGGPATQGLEDRFRPHFFGGVATVVAKLLIQSQCDIALFGEKDYQQLLVVKQMVRDLDLPCRIIGCPTVREADGLALSSRNAYLTAEERRIAPMLHQQLQAVAGALRAGKAPGEAIEAAISVLITAGFSVDYLELRDAETLAPEPDPGRGSRLLVAARLGKTRLIDNIAVY